MKLGFYLECLKKKLTSYFNNKIASEESEHDSELDDTCIYTENSDFEQSKFAPEMKIQNRIMMMILTLET